MRLVRLRPSRLVETCQLGEVGRRIEERLDKNKDKHRTRESDQMKLSRLPQGAFSRRIRDINYPRVVVECYARGPRSN